MNHITHDTYRTACGRGRATYRPDWDSSAPWILYVDGSCMRHVMSLQGADVYFSGKLLEPIDFTRRFKVYQEGDRVLTPHGTGTVYDFEKANDAWPGNLARWRRTGRYGVKLDGEPPICCPSGVAYYWPSELEDEP